METTVAMTLHIEILSDGNLRWMQVVTDEDGKPSPRPVDISLMEHITRRVAEHCSREITALRTVQMLKGEPAIVPGNNSNMRRFLRG